MKHASIAFPVSVFLLAAAAAVAGEPALQVTVPAVASAPSAGNLNAWLDRIKLSGKMRYRWEFKDDDGDPAVTDRHRHRIQAKLGADIEVTDEFSMGFHLATGAGNPVSTNVTLDGGFSTTDIGLDLAFIEYRPKQVQGLMVSLGRMKNPIYRPGKSELIWDGDLRPEGIGLHYERAAVYGVPLTLFGNAGLFWVEERSAAADTLLAAVQFGARYRMEARGEPLSVTGGVGYYDYGAIQGRVPSVGAAGNTLTGGVYQEDYNELEAFLEADWKLGGVPLVVFADVVINTGADISREDMGWKVGLRAGQARDKGLWAARINYRDLQADAVVGQFTDSDHAGGGTDARGVELGVNYMLKKHVETSLSLFVDENRLTTSRDDFVMVQADLAVKF